MTRVRIIVIHICLFEKGKDTHFYEIYPMMYGEC